MGVYVWWFRTGGGRKITAYICGVGRRVWVYNNYIIEWGGVFTFHGEFKGLGGVRQTKFDCEINGIK